MDVFNSSKRNRRSQNARSRKGAMIVLVAIATILLLVGAAFSVDIAYMFLASEQIHIATDAACKAAVTGLSQGKTEASAIQSAITCAGANTVCGKPFTLTSSNIVLGGVTYSDGYWAFTPGTVTKTAAQISSQTTVPLFFGCSLGTSIFKPARTSTAAFLRNKWCFVFDRSGSMCYRMKNPDQYPSGYDSWDPPHSSLSRWSSLVAASNTFLTAVATSPVQNKIGMVTFSTDASQDCLFSAVYSPITKKLAQYGAHTMNGITNLRDGLYEALDMFSDDMVLDPTPWNKVIIVLSDGDYNTGGDPLGLVNSANTKGIVIHTVGILDGGNNNCMKELASRTGGKSLLANNEEELKEAFRVLSQTIPVILTQ